MSEEAPLDGSSTYILYTLLVKIKNTCRLCIYGVETTTGSRFKGYYCPSLYLLKISPFNNNKKHN
jgi:hypothetical protein